MGQPEILSQKKCQPCEGIGSIFTKEQIQDHLKSVPEWQVNDIHNEIYRDYVMNNFLAAVQFIGRVAEVAERENHHPDIHLTGYRKLRVVLSTHALKGITENDFILAAKINDLQVDLKQ